MPSRKKTNWKKDQRGEYPRQIGWVISRTGKRIQPKFFLGKNLDEARRRECRIRELWDQLEFEQKQRDETPLWTTNAQGFAKQIAKGADRIVVKRKAKDRPDSYARWFHRLQRRYYMLPLVADDKAAYSDGAEANSVMASRMIRSAADEVTLRHVSIGNLTDKQVLFASDSRLHEALQAYIADIRKNECEPGYDGTSLLKSGAGKRIEIAKRLIERHDSVPLSLLLLLDELQTMIDYWRSRPAHKRTGEPITTKSIRNHLAEFRRFLGWLHRSSIFDWRKPDDFDELDWKVRATLREKQKRLRSIQVETFSIDELSILNKYATPLERVLFLLGLNCGYGAGECGTLELDDVRLLAAHPESKALGFASTSGDSFIMRIRNKTHVYGEHLLWKQTVEGVQWAIRRQKSITNDKELKHLFVTKNGSPYYRFTSNDNRGQRIWNLWSDLLDRVQRDHPDFRRLSFGKLRKTGINLVRVHGGGEVASLFAIHGTPFPEDKLLELYSNRPFAKLFETLRILEKELSQVFDAAGDNPFGTYVQKYTSSRDVERMLELHKKGLSPYKIAKEVGRCHTTVRRYLSKSGASPSGTKND